MRSSKSRSRSKSNRSRSVGNIVNRVFDSSGPEGKVRGTPQQIIDKYNQLARDAQLSNDRVAAENFQQHAEHYTRLLGEAQREQEARREQQEQQNRERQQQREQQQREQKQDKAAQPDPAEAAQPVVSDDALAMPQDQGDSGLVETPEEKPAPKRTSSRKPRSSSAKKSSKSSEAAAKPADAAADAPKDEKPTGDLPETPAAE